MPRRPRPMATARKASTTIGRREALLKLRPMNLYGWSKHLFDQAVVERFVQKEKLPPHWAGLEILQRLRPERVPQGPDDERVGEGVRRRQGRPSRSSCSSRIATASPTATSAAISSMSTTPSRCVRWLLETPRGQRHLQCRHRQGEKLPRHDRRDVQGARRAAEYRIRRHAGGDPRAISVFHAGRRSRICAAPATMPASRPLEAAVANVTSPVISTAPTVIAEHDPLPGYRCMFDFDKHLADSSPADRALRRRSDARRIRLWRGRAHFAGGADAGDRGQAQRDR